MRRRRSSGAGLLEERETEVAKNGDLYFTERIFAFSASHPAECVVNLAKMQNIFEE